MLVIMIAMEIMLIMIMMMMMIMMFRIKSEMDDFRDNLSDLGRDDDLR